MQICYTNTCIFKVSVTDPQGIFWFEQLLNNKVDFRASDFEDAVQLQIEAKQKILGWSVTFGLKSVEKRPPRANFFPLMTPNVVQLQRFVLQGSYK